MVARLVLTVTRKCNHRCSYCRSASSDSPSLAPADVTTAIDLFCRITGGGEVKIFGGEPLLVPQVVHSAIQAANRRPEISRITLSTNGLCLDSDWLKTIRVSPKTILAISLDGEPENHRRLRRPRSGVADAYDRVLQLLPELLPLPRVVITQTIAPSAAKHAAKGFHHLFKLGFRRFNFLPGYCIQWSPAELQALRVGFQEIGAAIRAQWEVDQRLYVRNLFTFAPTPFFNTGMVVDADGSIYPSNLGFFSPLSQVQEQTLVGTLDAPPSAEVLSATAQHVGPLLRRLLPAEVWRSTVAADRELTRFCRGLYPAYFAHRRRRRAA